MFLAIEYFTRKGITRDWLTVPCALFVSSGGEKFIITICEEFKPSEYFAVKHWQIEQCTSKQAIPPFVEYRVPKSEVFRHPAVIVPGCRLMPYTVEPIPASYNQIFRPMMAEFYNYYYQNYLESHAHSQAKNRWLWNAFIKVYLPDLSNISNYILMFKTAEEIASDQQKAVEKYHQEVWQYWLKWCKYMMYPGIPGELVFASDYRNQGGSQCPKSSTPP